MSSPNLVLAARKVEALPSDRGQLIDVLAGGLLRTFTKLSELERRVETLEKASTSRTTGNGHDTEPRT